MSLLDTIHRHERMEETCAVLSVKARQRGSRPMADAFAADSAMHRHLAFEHRDTHRITMDAFAEHYGVKR